MSHFIRSWPLWKTYVFLAVPAVILLNLVFPNFHAPDDYDHLKRAYTLFDQPFRTVSPPGLSTGAMIDRGLKDYVDAQIPLVKFERPLTDSQRRALQKAREITWSGSRAFSEMPGAMSYFPLLYAPQSIMLSIGRLSGATVEQSVLWARFANGLIALALAALGLHLLPGGRAFALLLLLLPRTLLQFASNSADPILYGLSLLLVSLGVRAVASERNRSALLATAIFISASVRPPIAALGLPAGIQALRERRWFDASLLAGACLAAVCWMAFILPSIVERRCGELGPPVERLRTFVLEWPWLIGRSFVDHGLYYYVSFVGHYGWGDARTGVIGVPMPPWVYGSALLLFAAVLAHDLISHGVLSKLLRTALVAGAACSVLIIFMAMYIGCTSSDKAAIGGVQGRYFVPPLFALALATGGLAPNARAERLSCLVFFLVAGWVIACTTVMLTQGMSIYNFRD